MAQFRKIARMKKLGGYAIRNTGTIIPGCPPATKEQAACVNTSSLIY